MILIYYYFHQIGILNKIPYLVSDEDHSEIDLYAQAYNFIPFSFDCIIGYTMPRIQFL